MTKINAKTVRYNFTMPVSDTQLAEWINSQHSLSGSLRVVIKDFISRHGMIDATCLAMSFESEQPTVQHHYAEPENKATEAVTKIAESEAEIADVSKPEPEIALDNKSTDTANKVGDMLESMFK